ncbi:hypothetical protein VB715_20935 [Crocosphaera sp. UHCC 0190]|uniref:phosphorylase family protein n=1 Tax=Crocosphaera sp. UHCC 0190 TaxID=3110246 RepID=UPI002B1EE95A|nr:hypothetical protein [Crocosphaera sp. UHCC 0190]MEA5512241.1 hypothetical protein [Crocosphaera sp. UHCC 0190]
MLSNSVDVLIIAALKEEFDALIEITDREETWERVRDSENITRYYHRTFESTQGFSFSVAAMWANNMGATQAAVLATKLTEQLNPRCIAMCGICAGKRGDVFLGDVLIADKVFRYDQGKHKVKGENEVFQPDITTFNLRQKWKTAIKEIEKKWQPSFINERSLSLEYQSNWLLRALHNCEENKQLSISSYPRIDNFVPQHNRQAVIQKLRQKKWIDLDSFQITSEGKKHLEEDRFYFPDSPQPDPQFRIHLGTIGTGTGVIQDPSIWDKITAYQRKTIGLEMEGEAIGIVSEIQEIDYMIFVKGVCDYADEFKDDSFHDFAAKASAAFLIDFLKGNLPKKSDYHHSVESDQEKLLRKSKQVMEQVSNKIGGKVHLERTNQLEKLAKVCTENYFTFLVGFSGVGKSSLARDYAEKLILENQTVLWFEAQSFEKIDFAAFETDLQLTHSLEAVIQSLSNQPATLIIDGLDRLYTPESFRLLATFFSLFKFQKQPIIWKLLITCQTPELSRLTEHLIRIGIDSNNDNQFHCSPLPTEELEPIWETFLNASQLKYQTHLKDIFGNLKVLDLVTIKLKIGENIPVNKWVNESSVATWFWESYIKGSNQGIVKGKLVKKLAEYQADTLKQGISLESLNFEESKLIDSILKTKICSQTSDDSIVFQHDLYGDWFRFRLLISHADNLINYLKERLKSPMWYRAVRLYGLYLLEHLNDINKWNETISALANDNNLLAQDLLLESLVFAGNSLSLLKLIHSHLIDNNGQLLKRLLTRFLQSATLPDPYFMEVARAKGYNEVEFAATLRYPYWPFWLPMLHFLYEYRDEFIRITPVEISQIVQKWLDYTSPGVTLRLEMAELGLMLGENALLARKNYNSLFHKHRKDFYRVALIGARELPKQVSNFVLRVSERIVRTNTAEEDEEFKNRPRRKGSSIDIFTELFSVSNTSLPEPWPDGPKRPIDNDFRKVVLEPRNIRPLIETNPSVAREIVLAVLISEPTISNGREGIGYGKQFEVKDIIEWNTPLYIHGPFLAFLINHFSEGLEVIARLVDFATERWQEQTKIRANEYKSQEQNKDKNKNRTDEFLTRLVEEGSRFPKTLIMSIDNVEYEFIGDSRVYGWSFGVGHYPHDTVIVALMALEQYFYRKIEEQEDINKEIKAVLTRIKSVAFLNVLCNIGKRLPILFETSLKPLLSVPEIYDWDINVRSQGNSHFMLFLGKEEELFRELARKFYQLEHRKKDLRNLAYELLFNCPTITAFFKDVKQRWETRLVKNPGDELCDFIKDLLLLFDIKNYEIIIHPEHGQCLVNVAQQKLQEEQAEQAEELYKSQIDLLIQFFPFRCRQMIDKKEPLNVEELEVFWNQLQQITSIDNENWGKKAVVIFAFCILIKDSYQLLALLLIQKYYETSQYNQFTSSKLANCIVGGIAVLIHFHRSWLSENPDREQWCLETLQYIILQPPLPEQFDRPDAIGNFYWDDFAAEALPLIWAEDKDNQKTRFLIALMVFTQHYSAVNILFRRCSELRSILREDFTRLRRLLFEWAFVRNRIQCVKNFSNNINEKLIQSFVQKINEWKKERVQSFVEGNMDLTIDSWKSMDNPQLFEKIDKKISSLRKQYYLDFQLITTSHVWLPTLDQATNIEERNDIILFFQESLDYIIRRVSINRQEQPWNYNNTYYPDDYEQWVLKKIAVNIQYMQKNEHPEMLWQTIIDLPKEAHYWSEIFLREFHRYGLQQHILPPAYILITRAIINHVLPSETDADKWSWCVAGVRFLTE